jgi:hypothetical protein
MYICTSQSLFSHSYVVNEWLIIHCNVQIDIGIRADELGTSHSYVVNEWLNRHCDAQIDIGIRADELGICPTWASRDTFVPSNIELKVGFL